MVRSRFLVAAMALVWLGAGANGVGAVGTYLAPITIDNTGGGALSAFEVGITIDTAALVAAGKLQPDADDLRFVLPDGSPLCFDVESGVDSASTRVWVKVPSIPAGGSTTIDLLYGDPAAENAESPSCTFTYWEGFDAPSIDFTTTCGSFSTLATSGGVLTASWASSAMAISGASFPDTRVLTAEAKIETTLGNWPSFNWGAEASLRSYAVLVGGSNVRIGVTPSNAMGGFCTGQNFVTSSAGFASPTGVWGITWVGTGDVRATFPGLAPITSTDTSLTRTGPFRLLLGGINAGMGSMTVDWVRARQFAAPEPGASVGAEVPACTVFPDVCDDGDLCTVDSCDPGQGCVHTAVACDDANACTADACVPEDGSCTATPVSCDDADACTDDSCDVLTGCAHALIRGATFAGVECPLASLLATVQTADELANVRVSLERILQHADELVRSADPTLGPVKPRAARHRLARARQLMQVFGRRVRKQQRRGRIPADAGSSLVASADALAGDLVALRASR